MHTRGHLALPVSEWPHDYDLSHGLSPAEELGMIEAADGTAD